MVLALVIGIKADRIDYATHWLMLSARDPASFNDRFGLWQQIPSGQYWAPIDVSRT